MKTTRILSTIPTAIILAAMLVAVAGCKKDEPLSGSSTSTSASGSTPAKPAVSAEKNSFADVTKQLDAGGSLYLYLGTQQWLTGLSSKIGDWRQIALALPNLGPQRENVGRVFDVVTHLIQNSGVEDVSGLGMSSIAREPGFYHSKIILHHYPGKGAGFMWSVFGKSPHALDGLELSPATTALSSFADVDLAMLWSVIEKEVAQSGIPGAQEGLQKALREFEQKSGLNWNKLMASLGGECGIIITLDDAKKVAIPLGLNQQVEIPEPGILLVMKVNNDLIFDRLEKALADAKLPVTKVDQGGLRMRTVTLPVPLPIQLRPSVARSGDYLMIATTDTLIQDALAVKSGKQAGLKSTAEFKKLAQDVPAQGNRFSFVSQRFGQTVMKAQAEIMEARSASNPGQPELTQVTAMMQKLMGLSSPAFSYAVAANSDEGWALTMNGNQNPGKLLLLPAVAVPAVGAAMLLPALAKAKARAQTISCVNNLKQIAVAARIWSADHKDVYPPDFLSMTNELGSFKVLNCPAASGLAPMSWADVGAGRTSYQMLAPGISDTADPLTVFVLCPADGNVVLMDGSVQQLGPNYQSRLKKVNGRTVLVK